MTYEGIFSISRFDHAAYAAGVCINVLSSLSIEMRLTVIWAGSPSLIHAKLMSVLDVESFTLCTSHDAIYTSAPVSCAVSRTAWKWRRAAEQPRPDQQCCA